MRARKDRSDARSVDVVLMAVAAIALAASALGWSVVTKDTADLGELESLSRFAAEEENQEDDGSEGPVDWGSLMGMNADICAWLSVEGTNIDLPVVHASEERPDWYLSHSFLNEKSSMGCPYLNWACDPDGLVETVYGHHVWYEARMFNELARTYEPARFSELGKASWSTPAKGLDKFSPLGSALIDMSETQEWNRSAFSSTEELRSWLGEVRSDLDAESPDAEELTSHASRVLVLVTCTETGMKSKRCVTLFVSRDVVGS